MSAVDLLLAAVAIADLILYVITGSLSALIGGSLLAGYFLWKYYMYVGSDERG